VNSFFVFINLIQDMLIGGYAYAYNYIIKAKLIVF